MCLFPWRENNTGVSWGGREEAEEAKQTAVEGRRWLFLVRQGKDSRLDAMWAGAVPVPLPTTRIGAWVLGRQLLLKQNAGSPGFHVQVQTQQQPHWPGYGFIGDSGRKDALLFESK